MFYIYDVKIKRTPTLGPPKNLKPAKTRSIAITTLTKRWKSLFALKAPKMNPKVQRWPWPDFLDFQVKAKIRNLWNEIKWQPAVAGIILAGCCSTRQTAASCSRRATTDAGSTPATAADPKNTRVPLWCWENLFGRWRICRLFICSTFVEQFVFVPKNNYSPIKLSNMHIYHLTCFKSFLKNIFPGSVRKDAFFLNFSIMSYP